MKRLLLASLVFLGGASSQLNADIIMDAAALVASFNSIKDDAQKLRQDMVTKQCPKTPQDLWNFLAKFKSLVKSIDGVMNDIGLSLGFAELVTTTKIPFINSKGVQTSISYNQILLQIEKLKGLSETPTEEQQKILVVVHQILKYIADKLTTGLTKLQTNKLLSKAAKPYAALVGVFKSLAIFVEVCKDQGQKELEAKELAALQAELAAEEPIEEL